MINNKLMNPVGEAYDTDYKLGASKTLIFLASNFSLLLDFICYVMVQLTCEAEKRTLRAPDVSVAPLRHKASQVKI